MAEIKPFQAYRPENGLENRIAALPYDVYDRSEAKEEVKKEPLSFLKIDRAETNFPETVGTYDDCVYEKASELLETMIKEGKFIQDEKPCYYLYEQIMDGRSQTGIVACASAEDYRNQVIKKHENTRADKVEDRIRHVDACSAQTGPIFLAYRYQDAIGKITEEVKREKPVYDFVSNDGIAHKVWIISEEDKIKTITDGFSSMDSIYIADGHHRCASAVKVAWRRKEENPAHTGEEEYNYFLSVLFPDKELMIMDYNRVVKDLNGHTAEQLLDLLKQDFEMKEVGEEPYKPDRKGKIGMFLKGKWYRLEYKGNVSENPVEALDVSILQEKVLQPVLAIKDPKTDNRIEFVGGIRGLKELEKRAVKYGGVAFAMFPTDISELFAVADAGLLMPPKSTWFEPKLRSGLFIHKF